MNLKDAKSYVEQTKDHIEVVCISGGEPFLYYDFLIKLVQSVRRISASSVWVFTNGFWALSDKITRERLAPLRELGVEKIMFSADAYHQEFIPVDCVRRGVESTVEMGMEAEVDARFLGSPITETPHNSATRKIVERLSDLGAKVAESEPWYVGRAAELLSQHVDQKIGLPGGKCDRIWSVGNLLNPEGVDIDQYGNVMTCPGISIGNARESPFSEVIRSYEHHQHSIVKLIAEEGPAGLVEEARRKGYVSRERYINKCHLCYDVRKFLRSHYEGVLTPKNCYMR